MCRFGRARAIEKGTPPPDKLRPPTLVPLPAKLPRVAFSVTLFSPVLLTVVVPVGEVVIRNRPRLIAAGLVKLRVVTSSPVTVTDTGPIALPSSAVGVELKPVLIVPVLRAAAQGQSASVCVELAPLKAVPPDKVMVRLPTLVPLPAKLVLPNVAFSVTLLSPELLNVALPVGELVLRNRPKAIVVGLVNVRVVTASPVMPMVTALSVLPNSSVGVDVKLPVKEPVELAAPEVVKVSVWVVGVPL